MSLVTPRGMFPGGNSGQAGITAEASGVSTAATPLPATVNSVDTVAGAADGVMLPNAIPGSVIWVINKTATAIQVFAQPSNDANPAQTPATGDVEDVLMVAANSTEVAGSTGISQAGHAAAMYICAEPGVWKQCLCVT